MSRFQYVVISPVRDEEQYLPLTIKAMVAQTARPSKWVLVDDGSRDRTSMLIDEAARHHPWIVPVHRGDRGSRQAGSGVVEAFYAGLNLVACDQWDFVVKLDGDLSFGADYFDSCLGEFEANPNLGIAGGTCCKLVDGRPVTEFEGEPPFHVRGPTKIYRRECFDAIGGLIKAPGWDTVDQVKANMLGWNTCTFEHICLVHHRPTGGAYGSWTDSVKCGLANYITGYDPVFMACKCVKRSLACRSVRGAREVLGLWCGYMKGYFRRIPRVNDPEMVRYLRDQQWRALTFRQSIWQR